MFFSCIEDEYLEVHLLFPLLHSSKQVLSLHHSTNVHTNDRVNTISLLEIAEHCFQHFSPCDTTIIYSVVYFALKWPLSYLTSFIFSSSSLHFSCSFCFSCSSSSSLHSSSSHSSFSHSSSSYSAS